MNLLTKILLAVLIVFVLNWIILKIIYHRHPGYRNYGPRWVSILSSLQIIEFIGFLILLIIKISKM